MNPVETAKFEIDDFVILSPVESNRQQSVSGMVGKITRVFADADIGISYDLKLANGGCMTLNEGQLDQSREGYLGGVYGKSHAFQLTERQENQIRSFASKLVI